MSSDKLVSCWNSNGGDDSHMEIQNRTNNVLEKYIHLYCNSRRRWKNKVVAKIKGWKTLGVAR